MADIVVKYEVVKCLHSSNTTIRETRQFPLRSSSQSQRQGDKKTLKKPPAVLINEERKGALFNQGLNMSGTPMQVPALPLGVSVSTGTLL